MGSEIELRTESKYPLPLLHAGSSHGAVRRSNQETKRRRQSLTRRLITLVIVGLLFSPVVPSRAIAQEATPGEEFVTPDPSVCQIEPHILESVTSLAGTPVPASPPTPSFDDAAPADAEIEAAVTAVARELVTCFNAGNFLSQFAFYTDDALLAIMPPALTVEDLAGFLGGEPEPLPEAARESVMVRDVMVLPDGRVTAYLVILTVEGIFTTSSPWRSRGRGM